MKLSSIIGGVTIAWWIASIIDMFDGIIEVWNIYEILFTLMEKAQ